MNEIIELFGHLFLIAIIQIVALSFLDEDKTPLQGKIINTACFLGSLYLVLQFFYINIAGNLGSLFNYIGL